MPAISAMVYPAPAYVRVEVNWADVGAATNAAVYRVDCLTGQRVPLRPYVCFNGDFLALSCGYGVFWDTEPQLDRCIYYCTQALDAAGNVVSAPAANLVTDTFSVNVVNGWGPTNNGLTYNLSGGTVPGDYDVTSGVGTQVNSVTNTLHYATVDTGHFNHTVQADVLIPLASATGAPARDWVFTRFTDTNNYYAATLDLETTGALTLRLQERVLGVLSILPGGLTVGTGHTSADWWTIKTQAWGNQLKAKAWLRTTPEPDWQITLTDASLLTGNQAGLGSRLETGSGNAPTTFSFDNFIVTDPCADLVAIEQCSTDMVVPSSGDFRLGDPVRPCNDTTLLFNAPIDPDCVPTQGIFFGNMSDETFGANTNLLQPVNSRRPIAVNRTRSDTTATLTVATKTFADRDALRTLNSPGSPLLLRGPVQYGIADRYMSVGDVQEQRPLSDHRVQPRTVTLPHTAVDRPSGPTQGVCGTRVQDLCDIYPSWNALIAAGLSYADLLRGKASTTTPIPDTVERTWSDVNSQYANWTAVNAGNTDWDDLRDGA
jgi:hypothetical protein